MKQINELGLIGNNNLLFVEFFKNYERIKSIIAIKNKFANIPIDIIILMNDKLKIPDITKKMNNLNIIYYNKNMELDSNDINIIVQKNYCKIYLFDYRLGTMLCKNNKISNANMHLALFKNSTLRHEKIILKELENYFSKMFEKDNIIIYIHYKMGSLVGLNEFNEELTLKELLLTNLMNTILLFELKK